MRLRSLLLAGLCVLAAPAAATAAAAPPLRALLVIGGCCHDYPAQKEILKQGLEARARLTIDIAFNGEGTTTTRFAIYEKREWASGYDVIIHSECSDSVREPAYVENILAPHRAGLPAVNLHCTMHSYRLGTDDWFEFCGIQSRSHGPKLPVAVTIVDPLHPIMKGLSDWTTGTEELYNNLRLFPGVHPLMRGTQKTPKGVDTAIVAWTNLYRQKTRVFSTTLGHANATVADPRYLDMVARGLLWACGKLDSPHLLPSGPNP